MSSLLGAWPDSHPSEDFRLALVEDCTVHMPCASRLATLAIKPVSHHISELLVCPLRACRSLKVTGAKPVGYLL